MLARAGTDTGEQVHVRGVDARGVIAPQFASPAPMTLEWSGRDPPAPNHTGINHSAVAQHESCIPIQNTTFY
jgi:hypothetical protein